MKCEKCGIEILDGNLCINCKILVSNISQSKDVVIDETILNNNKVVNSELKSNEILNNNVVSNVQETNFIRESAVIYDKDNSYIYNYWCCYRVVYYRGVFSY